MNDDWFKFTCFFWWVPCWCSCLENLIVWPNDQINVFHSERNYHYDTNYILHICYVKKKEPWHDPWSPFIQIQPYPMHGIICDTRHRILWIHFEIDLIRLLVHRVNNAAIRSRDLVTMQKGRPKTQKVRGKGRYKAFTPKTMLRTTLLEMICFFCFYETFFKSCQWQVYTQSCLDQFCFLCFFFLGGWF